MTDPNGEPDVGPEGVLVIAGLADPCGDIGTQGRYGLLSIVSRVGGVDHGK